MSRRNPEIEELERTVSVLRRQLDERRRDPGDMPTHGCGDRSCSVASPSGGMATNGGCRCDDRTVRLAMRWWRRRAAFLEETIREMADDERAVDGSGWRDVSAEERACLVADLECDRDDLMGYDDGEPGFAERRRETYARAIALLSACGLDAARGSR